MRLAMTLTCRDEADIIEDNLRYHLAQGVDFFVVGDNGSTDGSLEILERYREAGVLRLEHVPGGWRAMADVGHTRLARLACEMGADWVINNDSDEFWWPVGESLKAALDGVPSRFGMVLAPRTEFVPRPDGPGSFADRMTVRETHWRRPPRAAHRAHPQVSLWTSHPIDVWVDRGRTPRSGLVGKPALQTRAAHVEDEELDLVLAPRFPVGILHFPLRSFEQYERKVALAAANRMLGRDEQSRAVGEAHEAGELDRVYRELVLDDAEVRRGIAEGWLVEDTSLRDYLAACPDPLVGGAPPPGSGAWSAERRERERAELEAGAMYALSRYLQTAAYKKQQGRRGGGRPDARRSEHRLRRRLRRMRRRSRRDRARLERIRSSRWWRLRPRLPGAGRAGH